MERGLTMLMHSLMIGLVGYIIMVYLLKQSPVKAENRSILLTSSLTIYMVLFGHGLPTTNIQL
jgi:hypothetical protein|tara:strand:- start:9942 stop:10130 length:189 start_codon:yes stop_codon:yes gene_type:complete